MTRPLHSAQTPAALTAMNNFHSDIVEEVKKAVANNNVVIVGMAWNPVVKKARRVLDEKKIAYTYLEYGNYLSAWRKRLAIKLWSGWPTFPQVFVKGTLVGGCAELEAALADGSFQKLQG
ncbi:MAG TPA: glutaredoxin [Myxococcota bacterium]|nr:glutaredoxin [Myxococcota bacterium]